MESKEKQSRSICTKCSHEYPLLFMIKIGFGASFCVLCTVDMRIKGTWIWE